MLTEVGVSFVYTVHWLITTNVISSYFPLNPTLFVKLRSGTVITFVSNFFQPINWNLIIIFLRQKGWFTFNDSGLFVYLSFYRKSEKLIDKKIGTCRLTLRTVKSELMSVIITWNPNPFLFLITGTSKNSNLPLFCSHMRIWCY